MIIGSDVESDPLPVQPEGRRHFPPRAAFHLIRHRPALNHAPGSRTDCQIAGPAQIGLIQMACSVDPNENLAKAEWRIREAAGRGAQIVCLQELFRSQYFCREENA
jgi:hypothetical protein